MYKQFLMAIFFSILLTTGFVSNSSAQLTISDLQNAVVELRLAPQHTEIGDAVHNIGYVNLINKNGFLVKPYEDVTITLSSENTNIVKVPNSITIKANENFATFELTTSGVEGQTTISANYNDQTVYQTFFVGEKKPSTK